MEKENIIPLLLFVMLGMLLVTPLFEQKYIVIDNKKFTEYNGYGFKLKSATISTATILIKFPSGDVKEAMLPAKIDNMEIEYKGMIDEDTIRITISVTP
ncbi:MAG TPA: hypothetical protein ENF58_02030 [Candidatus Altiarchaeales archaeon]|nr:MAG: hypothetical protein DRP23_01070 [Thermotogota bacterium]HDI72892.1 hypothetical protein [Candidatus Altiarchaeales archaeon]